VESQYARMSFGIPVKSLQVSSDGDLKRAPHLKWLTLRKKTEQMVRDSNGTMKQIVVPSRMDVLFGRGTPLRSHVGNMRLTDLIEEDLEMYFNFDSVTDELANFLRPLDCSRGFFAPLPRCTPLLVLEIRDRWVHGPTKDR
jgi:hypothetical protein